MQIDRETLEEVEAALAGVPGALNASFGAGSEERENGSARRQAKFGERVDATREAVSSALARLRKAMEDGKAQTYDYYGCTPMEAKDG